MCGSCTSWGDRGGSGGGGEQLEIDAVEPFAADQPAAFLAVIFGEAELGQTGQRGLVAWIDVRLDPRNQASLACLTRLGFTEYDRQQRTWLIGGEWLDSVYLELRPR